MAGGESNSLDSDMTRRFRHRRGDLSYPPAWLVSVVLKIVEESRSPPVWSINRNWM